MAIFEKNKNIFGTFLLCWEIKVIVITSRTSIKFANSTYYNNVADIAIVSN